MTSYQNISESDISGYNDCPILDYSKKSSSSSSLASKKRRRPVLGHESSTNSVLSNRIPTPPSLVPRRSDSKPTILEPILNEAHIVSNDQLLEKLNILLQKPTSLPDLEFQYYSKRLLETIPNLKDEYKAVISSSLSDLETINPDKETVINDLVKFMLGNEGTSAWCQSLKKIIEKATI